MIRRVIVTNHLGESLTFQLPRPEESGLAISSIDGLGPVAASINSSESATMDGVVFNSARVSSRNIVFHFIMMWADTIEESRLIAYKYFPIKRQITMQFDTDNRSVLIQGVVESNEPEIFSEMQTTAVSIICPYPYFISTDINEMVFFGVEPLFEFPFSNEDLTLPLIELSEFSRESGRVIDYVGDADVGILFDIYTTGMVGDLTLYNNGTGETMKILESKMRSITGSQISPGDEILISTVRGDKYAVLIRDGQQTNILNCLDKDSDWIQLTRGENVLGYQASSGSDYIIFKAYSQILYEGI